MIAEDRVLKINPLNVGSSELAVELFFGSEYERLGDIIGLAVSISSSCVLINVKNRGLFAYRLQGKLYWSVGPLLYQHGYRQGCRKNITECYFSSVPVFDHCEASIYVRFSCSMLFKLVLCTRLYLCIFKTVFLFNCRFLTIKEKFMLCQLVVHILNGYKISVHSEVHLP